MAAVRTILHHYSKPIGLRRNGLSQISNCPLHITHPITKLECAGLFLCHKILAQKIFQMASVFSSRDKYGIFSTVNSQWAPQFYPVQILYPIFKPNGVRRYPNLNFTNIKPSNPKPNGNERRGALYIVVQSLESH